MKQSQDITLNDEGKVENALTTLSVVKALYSGTVRRIR